MLMTKRICWVLLLAILAFAKAAQAGTIVLEPGRDSYLVHAVVDVLEDPDGRLGFAEVSREPPIVAFQQYDVASSASVSPNRPTGSASKSITRHLHHKI